MKTSSPLLFLYGQFFLLFLAFCFFLPVIGFFVGIPVSGFYFVTSILLSIGITGYTGKELFSLIRLFKHLSLALLLLFLCVLIAGAILDTSWDGQWYHQIMLFKLKNGWNPEHNPLYALTPQDRTNHIWIQHYPKCYHIIATCIYAVTKHIESGKAINMIVDLSVFFYSLYFTKNALHKGKWVPVMLALLISLNPVIVSQLFSNYVDGFMGSLLCLLVLQLLSIELIKDGFERIRWATVGVLIIMICNIKFTGILISFILLGSYTLFWWFTRIKPLVIFKRYLLLGLVYLTAVLVFGFNPYVTNYRLKGTPVYPTNDKKIMAFIFENEPRLVHGKSNAAKFTISLFSRSDNVNDSVFHVKNPLIATKDEIRTYAGTDTRFGGMGPYFLLSFLLSLLLVVLLFRKAASRDKILLGSLLAGIAVSVVIFDFSWWARFVPQVYLWVLLILLIAFRYLSSQPSKAISLVSYAIMAVLFLNIVIVSGAYVSSNIIKTKLIREELRSLSHQPDPIVFNFSGTDFQSSRIRLQEAGVNFTESDTLQYNTQELRTIYKLIGQGPKYRIIKKEQ